MNIRMTFNLLGRTVLCEAALMAVSLVVGLIYGDSVLGFAAAIGIALLFGTVCLLIKPASTAIYAREGFVVCALSWIVLSLIGAVPFVIEGMIPNYIDAFFETVSGFTTTGASILEDFENAGRHGLFFWRSLTHYIGGMGVLVFMLAIMPTASESSMQLMRAEVPGPKVGKLVPKIKKTAIILYVIYVAITLLEIILLLFGGMNLFEAVTHAFSTAGTGGFSNRADSIAGYSPYIQYVISVFMLIFAVNFSLYYLILIRQWKAAVKNEELRWYIIIVALAILFISIDSRDMFASTEETVRTSLFHVSLLISSTGFLTVDPVYFSPFSQMVIFALMFIGACAGSTGGSVKVSRIAILIKSFINEIKRMLRPREVLKVRMDGKPLVNEVVHSVAMFFGMYMFIVMISMLIISLDGFDIATTASAVASCMGNMGPGLWQGSCYAQFSPLSKIVLSLDMLLGRLEILPIIMLFVPSVWKFGKKSSKVVD